MAGTNQSIPSTLGPNDSRPYPPRTDSDPPPPFSSQPTTSPAAPPPVTVPAAGPPTELAHTDAPPRYRRWMSRYAMRWPLIITSCLGFIWAIASGVNAIRDMSDDGETTKQGIFDVLSAILYFIVSGVEGFAIAVAAMQNVKLAKSLRVLAPLGVAVAVAACIVDVVAHFVAKTDIINQCTKNTVGAYEVVNANGTTSVIDEPQAAQLCNASWNQGTWRVFAFLVVVGLLALFFASFAITYYHQLANPASVQSQSIPLQNYANNPPPPPNNYWGPPDSQQETWMVPPYPGPAGPRQEGYEKSDYQPAAEWAQAGYAPPSGPPPAGSEAREMGGGYDAEEEAWERARSQGVTAHFTGHGPKPRRESEEEGYVVTNREEDEAWERARGEGITAHLTGHQKPRRDHDEV